VHEDYKICTQIFVDLKSDEICLGKKKRKDFVQINFFKNISVCFIKNSFVSVKQAPVNKSITSYQQSGTVIRGQRYLE
jgi:hypothetical protein